MMPADERPTYTIVLRPEPGVSDPARVLRAALKILLRRCGLRCVSIEQEPRA